MAANQPGQRGEIVVEEPHDLAGREVEADVPCCRTPMVPLPVHLERHRELERFQHLDRTVVGPVDDHDDVESRDQLRVGRELGTKAGHQPFERVAALAARDDGSQCSHAQAPISLRREEPRYPEAAAAHSYTSPMADLTSG